MPDVEVAELCNLSQQQTLNTLDRAQPLLMKALRGETHHREEDKRLADVYRMKTVILTEKAMNFKTFRRHRRPLEWPPWLQEAGMEQTLCHLHRHWKSCLQEEQALAVMVPPRRKVPGATAEGEILQLEVWVEWLREVLEAMEWRRMEWRRLAAQGLSTEELESVPSADTAHTGASTVASTSAAGSTRSSSLPPHPS